MANKPIKETRFWKAKTSIPSNRIFKSPESLWKACCQYFEWVENNPLTEEKVFQYQGEIIRTEVEKPRVMTIWGLCVFLGISRQSWHNFQRDEELSYVTQKVNEIIKNQKYTGAASDIFNTSLISKDLGLSEHHEISGPNGGPLTVGKIDFTNFTEEELDNLLGMIDRVSKNNSVEDDDT